MIVSIWKIGLIATNLALPSWAEVLKAQEIAQDAARKWALAHVPQEVRLMCVKYPQLNEIQYLYFRLPGKHSGRDTVRLDGFPCGRKFIPDSDIPEGTEAHKRCLEWHALDKQHNELCRSLRCAMSKINTYAKFKAEFPEAYTELLKLDEAQSKGSTACPCDAIESVRAKLKAKPKTDEKV